MSTNMEEMKFMTSRSQEIEALEPLDNIKSSFSKPCVTNTGASLPFFTNPSDTGFARQWSEIAFSRQALNDHQNLSIRSISIDITNGLKGKDDLMVTNLRVLCLVLFYVALTLPGFISFSPWAMIPSICVASLILVSAFAMEWWWQGQPYSKHKKTRYKYCMDRILHITSDDTSLKVPNWFSWYLVCISVWLMIAMYLAQSKYDNKRWVTRCFGQSGQLDSEDVKNGACLVRASTWTLFFWYLGYFGGVSLMLIRRPRREMTEMAEKVKTSLGESYEEARSKMKEIDEKIQKKNVRIQNRKLTLKCLAHEGESIQIPHIWGFFYAIFALFIASAAMYVGQRAMFWKVDEPRHVVDSPFHYAYVIYFVNLPFSAFLIYRTFEVLWNMGFLFQEDQIAMNALSGPIYLTKVQDVKCWYRMRQFYLLYLQPLQSGGQGSVLFAILLFISLGMSGYVAIRVRIIDDNLTYFNSPDGFMSSSAIVMLVYFLLRYLKAAVSVHNAQLSHIKLLKSEILRLEFLSTQINTKLAKIAESGAPEEAVDCEDMEAGISITSATALQSQKLLVDETKDCVNLLVSYLEEFDEAPRVFGIPMNNALLYSIYSYVSGIVLMLLSTWWGW